MISIGKAAYSYLKRNGASSNLFSVNVLERKIVKAPMLFFIEMNNRPGSKPIERLISPLRTFTMLTDCAPTANEYGMSAPGGALSCNEDSD